MTIPYGEKAEELAQPTGRNTPGAEPQTIRLGADVVPPYQDPHKAKEPEADTSDDQNGWEH